MSKIGCALRLSTFQTPWPTFQAGRIVTFTEN